MASYLNTLGSVSRRGQWRFRQVLRALRADGRIDLADDGLIDFTSASDIVLTATPRHPLRSDVWFGSPAGSSDGYGSPAPALMASLSAGTLAVLNPGFVEAVFPAGSLLRLAPGIYDVRISITIGPETAEIFDEPVEFA